MNHENSLLRFDAFRVSIELVRAARSPLPGAPLRDFRGGSGATRPVRPGRAAAARALPRAPGRDLAPLIDSGLVRDDGAHIAIFWPPVLLRFLHRRGGDSDWVPVAPGAIPLARGGDRLRIEATSQLEIELRAFLVTHRGESREPCRPLARRRLITAGQTRSLELELDEEPGFEQILVHLTWPTERGMRALAGGPAPVGTPMPHVLHQERAAVIERAGPGWVEELLVHHL